MGQSNKERRIRGWENKFVCTLATTSLSTNVCRYSVSKIILPTDFWLIYEFWLWVICVFLVMRERREEVWVILYFRRRKNGLFIDLIKVAT